MEAEPGAGGARSDDAGEVELEAEVDSWLPSFGLGAPALGDEVGLPSEWAVPWSDLMMVMFILFVVLFIYEASEREIAEAFQPDARAEERAELLWQPPDDAAEPLYQQSVAAVENAALDAEVVLQEDRSVKLSLRGSVFFELGKAELQPEARSALDRLARLLAQTERELRVIGHTDNFPIHSEQFPTNWELSAARASAVARYLIRRGHLDPARVTVAGRSFYEPAVPNTTPANKALNRRVELVIAAAHTPVEAAE